MNCRHLRKNLAAHRAALALFAAGLAAVALFRVLRNSSAAMTWWVERVSMPFKQAVSALVDPLPFSFCELAATLAILACLILLGRCVWLAVRRRVFRFVTWALHTATVVLWIYAAVCALWGTQYYAPGFARRAGMKTPPLSVDQLACVADFFARRADALAHAVPRDETGCFAVGAQEILDASGGIYDAIVEEYPFLEAPARRPKPAFYSKLMSAAGFTGYLCPLFGESTLNVDCPAVFLPVTVAHEFSHQRGVAAEQEANFVGIRAATTCGDAVYAYSGWLFGYLHLSNAWYSVDPAGASEHYRTLSEPVRADLAANNEYWARWEGPAREAGEKVYTEFLKSYDQELGMKSYGACVDLLVEYYLPLAQSAGD